MPDRPDSNRLERDLQEAGRHLSAATIAFHRRVAQRLGLNDTDHKCLDILLREGPMTAGSLARLGGYTTGAITGIVNRLVGHGLVSRITDPEDARRVVLEADAAETRRRMSPLLGPMVQRLGKLHAAYDPTELQLVLGYLQRCATIIDACAAELSQSQDD